MQREVTICLSNKCRRVQHAQSSVATDDLTVTLHLSEFGARREGHLRPPNLAGRAAADLHSSLLYSLAQAWNPLSRCILHRPCNQRGSPGLCWALTPDCICGRCPHQRRRCFTLYYLRPANQGQRCKVAFQPTTRPLQSSSALLHGTHGALRAPSDATSRRPVSPTHTQKPVSSSEIALTFFRRSTSSTRTSTSTMCMDRQAMVLPPRFSRGYPLSCSVRIGSERHVNIPFPVRSVCWKSRDERRGV